MLFRSESPLFLLPLAHHTPAAIVGRLRPAPLLPPVASTPAPATPTFCIAAANHRLRLQAHGSRGCQGLVTIWGARGHGRLCASAGLGCESGGAARAAALLASMRADAAYPGHRRTTPGCTTVLWGWRAALQKMTPGHRCSREGIDAALIGHVVQHDRARQGCSDWCCCATRRMLTGDRRCCNAVLADGSFKLCRGCNEVLSKLQ